MNRQRRKLAAIKLALGIDAESQHVVPFSGHQVTVCIQVELPIARVNPSAVVGLQNEQPLAIEGQQRWLIGDANRSLRIIPIDSDHLDATAKLNWVGAKIAAERDRLRSQS